AIDLSGLDAGTTYHVRLVATNETGTTYGDDHAVATAVWLAPSAQTAGATGVKGGAATLNGRVNANDAPTTYHFEYGTTTAYGSSAPAGTASGHLAAAASRAPPG